MTVRGELPFNSSSLESWMDRRSLGTGPIEEIEPVGGGTQNVVVRFRRSRDGFVLRCGPPAAGARSNDTMRREARVLQALANSEVPVPEMLGVEDDPAVLGRVFYVMAPVHGHSVSSGMRELLRRPDAHHRLGLSMVEVLGRLAAVDHRRAGLQDFGRPSGFLERQVRRWSRQLLSYSQVATYPGPGLVLEPVESWLEANVPPPSQIGVLHGDFHVGNVLFDDDGEVAAVVDWELSTIGDPQLDLAHLLVTWPLPEQEVAFAGLVPAENAYGFATREELIERYETVTASPLQHLDWYCVLAAYRLAVLVEGTAARASAGLVPEDRGQLLHSSALDLWQRALEVVRGCRVLP